MLNFVGENVSTIAFNVSVNTSSAGMHACACSMIPFLASGPTNSSGNSTAERVVRIGDHEPHPKCQREFPRIVDATRW